MRNVFSVLIKLIPKIIESMINIIFSKLLILATTYFLAQKMQSEQFGKYSYIYATIVLFQSLASFSMAGTAAKHIAIYSNDNKMVGEIIGFVLIISAIGGFIGCLFFTILAELGTLNFGSINIQLILLSGFAIFFGSLTSTIKGIIVGMEKIRLFTYISIATALIYTPVLYWLELKYKLFGAIASIFFFFFFDFLFTFFAIYFILKKASIKPHFSLKKINLSIILDFSLPSALSGIVILISTWLGLFLVGKTNGGFHQVAIFSIANQWRTLLLLLPAISENVTVPLLSRIAVQDKKNLKINILANFLFISLTGGIFLIVILFFKDNILSYYGSDYVKSENVFSLMIFSGFLFALNSIIGQFISSAGSMWHGFIINTIWCCIFLSGIFLFVTDAYTLALCYFVSYVIHGVVQSLYFFKLRYRYGFDI